MLLICNYHSQPAEKHILLNQGMRTDYNIEHSHLQRSQQVLAFAAGHTSCQQAYGNSERFKHLGERSHMLLRKNLGGHHQRPLKSGFHGGIEGNCRQYGFA
ncbi:hypothetical protein D3C75_1227080 [compost metagenome]